MQPETKDNLALAGKSVLLAIGALMAVAATVDLFVSGPNWRAFVYLVVGLALVVPPLALAFRDALRAGRMSSE